MNTCETCAHWVDNNGWTDLVYVELDWETKDFEPKEGYEDAAIYNKQSGVCSKITAGWDWTLGEPLPVATCWDGSGYKASLHTHKSFGCALWEDKK